MDEVPKQLAQSLIIRKSLVTMFLRLILAELLVAVVYVAIRVALAALQVQADVDLSLNPFVLTKSLLFTSIEIIIAMYIVLQWANNYYILKPEKEIVYVTGIITRKERSFSLSNVQSISSQQGLFGRILKYGAIRIFSPALQQEIYLTEIPNPKEVVEKIKQIDTALPAKTGFIIRR